MDSTEFAKLLREAYDHAPERDKSLHMTLFGIRHAQQLDRFVAKDICALADVGNWGPQLNLAKKLAQHVTLK